MTRDDVAGLLHQACTEVLVLDEHKIAGPTVLAEELDVDSLDIAEIIEILRDEGISLPVEDVMRARTFDDLVDLAHGYVTAGSTR